MPTAIHEMFIESVKYDIVSQLRAIGVAIARDIRSIGSTDIKFGDNGSKHSPDAAFQCLESQYPHLVMEVSYSQKQKDLTYLADTYIVDSDGSIGVVIGLDIEYKGSMAMLQMWRRTVKNEGGENYLESQRTVSEVRTCLKYKLEEANGKRLFAMKMGQVPRVVLPSS